MQVTVLGGSTAGGNTGMGCSGYLFESEGAQVVVDQGPGTMLELRQHCDFRQLSAIIISHWHVDHYLDLAAFRFAGAYNPLPAIDRIPLFLPPGGAELLSRFGMTLQQDEQNPQFFDDVFDISEFDLANSLAIQSMTFSFEPTIHFIPCWAIRVESESGHSIGYSADTGPHLPLVDFFAGADLLIAEATDIDPSRPPGLIGHMTGAEAGTLAAAANVKSLLLTHIWEERGFDTALDQARQTYAGPIDVARPGLTIVTGARS